MGTATLKFLTAAGANAALAAFKSLAAGREVRSAPPHADLRAHPPPGLCLLRAISRPCARPGPVLPPPRPGLYPLNANGTRFVEGAPPAPPAAAAAGGPGAAPRDPPPTPTSWASRTSPLQSDQRSDLGVSARVAGRRRACPRRCGAPLPRRGHVASPGRGALRATRRGCWRWQKRVEGPRAVRGPPGRDAGLLRPARPQPRWRALYRTTPALTAMKLMWCRMRCWSGASARS